ncbi:MAG: agmatine deiminase family protein [Myxococcota bacterium]
MTDALPTDAEAGGWPAEEGFRWPAEWEPHRATWLSWPHNPDTWPGAARMARVEEAFVRIVESLADGERVAINVCDEPMEERVRRQLRALGPGGESAVEYHRNPTDDAWVRDHGPVFLVRGEAEARERALLDFRFDAWGGKYPPWDRDDAVPARIARSLGVRRFAVPEVLEAGSIDGDGEGTVLTTESCLLHPNRGARRRDAAEALLRRSVGARRVLWLADGIEGDDTDGHVDDITRFVGPGRVVTAIEADPADANHAPLDANRRRLASMVDSRGRRLEVVELPMPRPVRAEGGRCPASYANFYVGNRAVLVPAFDDPADARARAILAECFPEREIRPIDCRDLVVGLGALHCLTQQEPA